ncbi:hypothetical protein FA95DRAFT_1613813 [Auriscalpium vulgare]|uniref:Uncharacterized protein n=1 Tax=Auriscalpium vulgare TaxID=40419 RepID=A0ACB8R1A0_9AGAM|nr:hypothetical protein FA95DRAFT_1613813 [Auriscalpium vulgare]
MPLCFAAYPIQGLRDPRFDQVQKLTGTAVPALVLAAIADIALAASLAYYLHKARTGIKPSDTIVKKLILYAVTTGLVPGINRLLDLIVYLALPEDFFYQAFNFPICKLYTNTLLAT